MLISCLASGLQDLSSQGGLWEAGPRPRALLPSRVWVQVRAGCVDMNLRSLSLLICKQGSQHGAQWEGEMD